MDQLRAIRYFLAVADGSTFTEAAEQFHVPASSISRRITDLETELGATLLQRTTRTVKLTEVGRSYYSQVKNIVSQLEVSNESVRTYHSEPMGHLRISSMVGFGESVILPLMEKFSIQYPKVVLDISLSDEVSTLNRDDIDIAIRGGYPPNERVIAVNLLDNQFYPVASPHYLATNGVPTSAIEFKTHRGLYFRTPNGPTPWLSNLNNQWQDVSAPAVAISNEGSWLIKQAIEGKGIVLFPKWVTQPFVDSGELIEIETSPSVVISQQQNLSVFLLYQKQKYLVPKVKAAVDFLVDNIKEK